RLKNIPTTLAYRFESRDFAARLLAERTAPSIAARCFSFLTLGRDRVAAHYELSFDVREARARQLVFSLPASTPAEITIRGLENANVKEHSSQAQEPRRRWTVQLAEKRSGRIRLAVDFTQQV